LSYKGPASGRSFCVWRTLTGSGYDLHPEDPDRQLEAASNGVAKRVGLARRLILSA